MTDLLFVAVMVAFFALAALFVRVCDRVIGPDERTIAEPATSEPDPAQVAA